MPISLCQASRTTGHWFKGLAEVGKAEEEESKSVLFASWNEHQRVLNAVLRVCSFRSDSIDFCKLAYYCIIHSHCMLPACIQPEL